MAGMLRHGRYPVFFIVASPGTETKTFIPLSSPTANACCAENNLLLANVFRLPLRSSVNPLIHTLLKFRNLECRNFVKIPGVPPHGKDVGGAEQVAGHRGRRRNDVRVRHRRSPAKRLHRPAGQGYPPHGCGGVVLGSSGQGGRNLGRHVYAGRSREQVCGCVGAAARRCSLSDQSEECRSSIICVVLVNCGCFFLVRGDVTRRRRLDEVVVSVALTERDWYMIHLPHHNHAEAKLQPTAHAQLGMKMLRMHHYLKTVN